MKFFEKFSCPTKVALTLTMSLGPALVSCGDISEEDIAAAVSALSLVENSDCFETEDEGYVGETSTETEAESEEAALAECVADLQSSFDFDGDGTISTDEEITSLNTHIEERKALKKEQWDADGLSEEDGRARDKSRRKLMREIALEACLADHDADADGELSKEEHQACHKARKAERLEIRQDLRCEADSNGECGPLSKEKLTTIRKEKMKKRDDFLDANAPDGKLPEDKEALRSAFKSEREDRTTAREGRVNENKQKEETGRKARKDRGKLEK